MSACIPLALAAFAWNLMPFVCRRYRVTDKRIVIHKGYSAVEQRAIDLDAFDEIAITRLPGQEWLHCGEMTFRQSGTEAFHLSGVSRPEIFRQVCL